MDNTSEIKEEIAQLNEQNRNLNEELKLIKELLKNQGGANGNQQQMGSGMQDSGNQQGTGDLQNSEMQQGSSSQQGSGNQQSPDQGIFTIAGELLKLKSMTSQLEQKMSAMVSNQSNGQAIKQKDFVKLVISMMNGMVDWTLEQVIQNSNPSGQSQ